MSALAERIIRSRRTTPPPALWGPIRRAAGATQGDVAGELHVHRVTVARWEAGTRSPRGDLLERYLRLLTELGGVAGV
jgi:DNA-binding transcriptional regulator YiaG